MFSLEHSYLFGWHGVVVLSCVVTASKLERCYLKVLTYCNYANTLGKALNTAKVELAKAKDDFTKLR